MKKYIDRLFSQSERALLSKDFANLWTNRGMGMLMSVVPFTLIFIIPVIFIVTICLIHNPQANLLATISSFIPAQYSYFDYQQGLFYVFSVMLSPVLYIIVPILTASFSTVFLFTGEKENGSMETLLYSSIPTKNIFKAKTFCVFVNSLVISLVSFFILEIILLIGCIILKVPYTYNLLFGILAICGTPAVIFLSIFVVFWVSKKTNTVIDAISASGYIMAPFLIAFIGQFAGIYSIDFSFMVIVIVAISVIDFIVYGRLKRKINDNILLWGKK